MSDKNEALAKLVGGITWNGEVLVRKSKETGSCESCVMAKYFIEHTELSCFGTEFGTKAKQVNNTVCRVVVWVRLEKS